MTDTEFQSILNMQPVAPLDGSAFLDSFTFPSDDSSPFLPFLELGFICSHLT